MNQADLIRASFDLVAPRADELIGQFYSNLFQAAPGVRGLFPNDMTAQKKHLAAAVGLVVKHADDLTALDDALGAMGRRHVEYGAVEAHYPVVRDVLLQTLGEFAGDAWSPEINQAWTSALNTVAGQMLAGVQDQRVAA